MPPDWPTRTMPLSISLSLSLSLFSLFSSLSTQIILLFPSLSFIPSLVHSHLPQEYSRIAWAIPPDLLPPTPTDSPHWTLGDNYPHPQSSIAATTIALILTTRFLSPRQTTSILISTLASDPLISCDSNCHIEPHPRSRLPFPFLRSEFLSPLAELVPEPFPVRR